MSNASKVTLKAASFAVPRESSESAAAASAANNHANHALDAGRMSHLAAKLAAAKKAVPPIGASSGAAAAAAAAAAASVPVVVGSAKADADVIAFEASGQLVSFGDVKASDETSAFKGTGSLLDAATGDAAERLLPVRPGTPPPKIDAQTGEEDEKTAFQARSTLFVLDQNEWRERGGGYLKVNLQKGGRARLLQRQEGSLKVILNAALQYKMPYAPVGDRAVRFIVCDASSASSAGTADDHRSQSWLARFARSDEADAFIAALKMALVTVPQPSAADAAAAAAASGTARKKRALDEGSAATAETAGASGDEEQARAKKAATEQAGVQEKKEAEQA